MMNRFLQDILDQPVELAKVLHYFDAQRESLSQGAACIRSSGRVVLTSMGSAYYSLMPMFTALSRLHPNVHLVETAELMRQPRHPGTLYVIMSRSGESGEIAAFSGELHKAGESLIAITMTPTSTLARNASLVIHDPASFDGLICTKAYSSMTLTGLLLAVLIEGAFTPDLVSRLDHGFAWLEQEKNYLHDQVANIPWLGKSLTFLSRGDGATLAASGVLWLEEAARIRASYANIDFFMHGSVEQVDETFQGVWIDLHPDQVSSSQHADLLAKGAQLFTICTPGTYTGDLELPDLGLPAAFLTLLGCMPVQLIAYQRAALRGLQAGEMRYLEWVVR